ncbi:MAG: nucleotidyltransferase family protein [Nitrospira sp.]|nr:nucleotidyltransferase family protein [Nitrospira sp.]
MYLLDMSKTFLTREEAIRRLQAVEYEIPRLGVRRLALFGSVLRNEARPDSDVDVLVEFTPIAKTFDRFMALADLLEDTLEHRVEVVTTESLSPFIGPHILAEATDVLRRRKELGSRFVAVQRG